MIWAYYSRDVTWILNHQPSLWLWSKHRSTTPWEIHPSFTRKQYKNGNDVWIRPSWLRSTPGASNVNIYKIMHEIIAFILTGVLETLLKKVTLTWRQLTFSMGEFTFFIPSWAVNKLFTLDYQVRALLLLMSCVMPILRFRIVLVQNLAAVV